jgi:hypothetical protein
MATGVRTGQDTRPLRARATPGGRNVSNVGQGRVDGEGDGSEAEAE